MEQSRRGCVGEGRCSGLTGQKDGFLALGALACAAAVGWWDPLLARAVTTKSRRRPKKGPPQQCPRKENGARARCSESCASRRPAPAPTRRRGQQRPRHWPAGHRGRRSGGDQARGIRHTIKKRARRTAGERRGCEAAWSAPRENFAGRFPASLTSNQRSVLAQPRWHRAE